MFFKSRADRSAENKPFFKRMVSNATPELMVNHRTRKKLSIKKHVSGAEDVKCLTVMMHSMHSALSDASWAENWRPEDLLSSRLQCTFIWQIFMRNCISDFKSLRQPSIRKDIPEKAISVHATGWNTFHVDGFLEMRWKYQNKNKHAVRSWKTVGRRHAGLMTFCCMKIWWESRTFITEIWERRKKGKQQLPVSVVIALGKQNYEPNV